MSQTQNEVPVQRPAATAEPVSPESRRQVRPRTDIQEYPNGVTLWIDVPGVTEDQVEVAIEQGRLNVTARRESTAPEGHVLRYGETEPVDYHRSFVLSEDLDAARVSATLSNGVLRVDVPRAESHAPRRIEVRPA